MQAMHTAIWETTSIHGKRSCVGRYASQLVSSPCLSHESVYLSITDYYSAFPQEEGGQEGPQPALYTLLPNGAVGGGVSIFCIFTEVAHLHGNEENMGM